MQASKEEYFRKHAELLQEENAFVDVGEVLRRKRSRAGDGGNDVAHQEEMHGDDDFLGSLRTSSRRSYTATQQRSRYSIGHHQSVGSNEKGVSFPKRLNLTKALSDQHKKYLQALSEIASSDNISNSAMPPGDDAVGSSSGSASSNCMWLFSDAIAQEDDKTIALSLQLQMKMLQAWQEHQESLDRSSSTPQASDSSSTLPVKLMPQMPSFLSTFRESSSEASGARGGRLTGNGNRLCSVCIKPFAEYVCVRCKVARFCSIECHEIHDDTRCLKFVE